MAEATFTFQVEAELKEAFSEAAKAQDKTDAQLLRRLMQDYVRQQREAAGYDTWFRRKVENAIASADAGNLIPEDHVDAEFAELRAAARNSSAQ
jgi:predicted transcriptional regulator